MAAPPAAPEASGHPVDSRGRYGERERPLSRRWVVVVASVCGVLAAAGFGWVAWGMLQPQAEAEVGRFTVVDETRVDVSLDVTRPVGSTAVCTIEALGAGFAQVGLLDVTVEPADTSVTSVPVSVATSELATVAMVRNCRLL